MEIFENLSIQLHDDGIDEATLHRLSKETGGKYYPAKDASKLEFILEKVSQSILKQEYVVTFPSLRQVKDGTARQISTIWVMLPDASFTPMTCGIVASLAQVAASMLHPVRPGTL